MKKILILGPSQSQSVGVPLAQLLRHDGYFVLVASRSGRVDGVRCDVTDPKSVQKVISEYEPNVIVHAAGITHCYEPLGQITRWSDVRQTLDTKVLGTLVVLDAATKCNLDSVIFLAGVPISSEPGFALYSAANGAIWNAVQFANRHTALRAHYLELGLVANTLAAESYLGGLTTPDRESVMTDAITTQDVFEAVKSCLIGHARPEQRLTVNRAQL